MERRKSKKDIVSDKRKRILLSCGFILLAIVTILVITLGNDSFSFKEFMTFLKDANKIYLSLAFICVFLFILFEGLALRSIASSFGYKRGVRNGFVYSSADIYFSAITPSATGGQPMAAYFMYKDGIPGTIIAITLLYNLMMYSLSFCVIGIITFILEPFIYFDLTLLSKILILIGTGIQFGIAIGFYFLLYKDQLLDRLCSFFIRIGYRLHIVKNQDTTLKRLHKVMDEYKEYALVIKSKRGVWFKALTYNILQRVSQIGVIIFVFLATSGSLSEVMTIWAIEVFVIGGSYGVPIPGGMGASDYLMLDGYNKIMNPLRAANLQLLSRGISFYFCILFCGIIVLVKFLLGSEGKNR